MKKKEMIKAICFIFLLFFAVNDILNAKTFLLKWRKEEKTVKYIIEIAKDKKFTELLYKYESTTHSKVFNLPIGIYFVRVYGLDKKNVKSEYSPVRKMIIRLQKYMYIHREGNKIYVPEKFTLDFLKKENEKGILYYKLKSNDFIKYTGEMIKLTKNQRMSYYFLKKGKEGKIKSFSLIVDSSPPKYQLSTNEIPLSKEKYIQLKSESLLEITGKDDLSGVKEILYSYDKKIFYLYVESIFIYQKTPFTLYFKLIDRVGNVTPIYEKKVTPY